MHSLKLYVTHILLIDKRIHCGKYRQGYIYFENLLYCRINYVDSCLTFDIIENLLCNTILKYMY